MSQALSPEPIRLLATIERLLRKLDDHEVPARFCRREIRKLCKHLVGLDLR